MFTLRSRVRRPEGASPADRTPERAGRKRSPAARNPRFTALATGAGRAPTGPIQAKLEVGRSDDPLELEADRVADQVMRMPVPAVQRACCASCAGGGTCAGDQVRRDTGPGSAPRRSGTGGATSGPVLPPGGSIDASLVRNLGPGQPLSPADRAFFEPRFGADFSSVRLHTGTQAQAAARALDARALTVGANVAFSNAAPPLRSQAGRLLIAHELAHVVQQRAIAESTPSARRPSNDADTSIATRPVPLERLRAPLNPSSQRPLVQRQHIRPTGEEPPMRQGTPEKGRCELEMGVFFWHIIPGMRESYIVHPDPESPLGYERQGGGCFNVQIVFSPGYTRTYGGAGARWVRDMRPIALVQTVVEREGDRFNRPPELDVMSDDTDPFYGAEWDPSTGLWVDEPNTRQGCSSLPWADAGTGQRHRGSAFSRGGSYGAVINDSPMLVPNRRKDFQTVAVVMRTGEPLGTLFWSIVHDGNVASVERILCQEGARQGFEELVNRFYEGLD